MAEYDKVHKGCYAIEESLQARVKLLEEALQGMKRTSIGPDRSVPEGTEIWFMFADERRTALAEGDTEADQERAWRHESASWGGQDETSHV